MRGRISDPIKEALRRKKISETRKRKKIELGYLNSPETRINLSEAKRGIKLTAEHSIKISNALKGKKPKNFEEMQKLGWKSNKGRRPINWKGDAVGYYALHAWVSRHKGTPKKCEQCGTTKAKRYEWANISREYKRDLNDYRRLCTSCHRKEGFEKGEYMSWIKGTHRQTNTGRTHFRKDMIPWNKGIEVTET